MAAFATVENLGDYLGDPGLDTGQAQIILDAVSDEIRDTLGWAVTQETGVTATLDGPGDEKLLLPTLHLTAVSSVVEDDKTLTAEDYLLYERGYLRRVVNGFGIDWTDRLQGVTVVFDHGYASDSLPGVFKMVTMEYAAKVCGNPAAIPHTRTVGRVSVSYTDIRSMLPPIDDARLDYYRLPEGF